MGEEERKAKNRARQKAWREANPDKVKAKKDKYLQSEGGKAKQKDAAQRYRQTEEYKAKARERSRLWRLANPDREKKTQEEKRSKPENREKAKQAAKTWHEENRGRAEKWRKTYYAKHREEHIACVLLWQKNNPEKRAAIFHNYRARKRKNGGTLSANIVERLTNLQKSRCACCKTKLTQKNRHLDHIVPLATGGANSDDNVQLLCASCNCSKRAKDPTEFMQSRGYLL